MSEELKPCPFCGSKVVTHIWYKKAERSTDTIAFTIRCENGCCERTTTTTSTIVSFETITTAMNEMRERWNSRKTDKI